MPISAVLFDIDGTLVDSNYAHVAAWTGALERLEHPVDSWRIHRAIGMDSAMLIDELLGGKADELGEEAKRLHGEIYTDAAGHLRAFAHARELVAEVARRGQRAVLATSAPEDELAILRGVLKIEDDVDAITSSSEVQTAKPAPDVVQVALDKAAVGPAEAVFVGDSIWDVRAALTAGVACVGLLSGGTGRLELLEAGAIAVYDDAADLLAHYDEHLA
jgi:phosphoglycolate phosphatase-like HAD superfamily hydrolase